MPPSDPTYRRATLADLAAVCSLGQVINRLHYEAWPNVFAPASDPGADEAHWREGIEGEGCAAFVAEVDGEVVGFITASVATENHPLLQPLFFARVRSVCVTPQARGQGIGRGLMELAEAWAMDAGAVEIRLNVWEFNASAVRLYKELGYGVRSFHMCKPLVKDEP
jgi:ribosomal protein S18 acetylase RimI-like enzyme